MSTEQSQEVLVAEVLGYIGSRVVISRYQKLDGEEVLINQFVGVLETLDVTYEKEYGIALLTPKFEGGGGMVHKHSSAPDSFHLGRGNTFDAYYTIRMI